MKISDTTPVGRTFTLEVSEQELQFISRALYLDDSNNQENTGLYNAVFDFADANDVEDLAV